MRVMVIAEGDSEYVALPELFSQIGLASGNTILPILKISVQPDGPPLKIARECKTAFKLCAAKGAERVIVVLDREQQSASPGTIAATITTAIEATCNFDFEVFVVVKDRAFENWVIADLDALRAQRARYNVTGRLKNAVEPNRADSAAALALLNDAAIGGSYEKKADGKKTLARADVARIGRNSRSFRHFLHMMGDPAYISGCRTPAITT